MQPSHVPSRKVVIVTDASSGIGRATALRFADEGADIIVVGRHATALDRVIGDATARGGRARAIVADVTATDAPDRIVRDALDAFGGIDVLVNATGIIGSGTVDKHER